MIKYIPKWPKLHIKTFFSLIKTYLNTYWSWYGKNELNLIKKFSKLQTVKYCITSVSGTVALETILQALNIKSVDEVIVPAYTWISSITCVAKTVINENEILI